MNAPLAAQRRLLPTRATASPAGSKLCHVCGECFPKAGLPTHQRSCVRKSLRSLESSPAKTTHWESADTFPCTHCMQHIPSRMLQSHLRTCNGTKHVSQLPRPPAQTRSLSMSNVQRLNQQQSHNNGMSDALPDVELLLAAQQHYHTQPSLSQSLPKPRTFPRQQDYSNQQENIEKYQSYGLAPHTQNNISIKAKQTQGSQNPALNYNEEYLSEEKDEAHYRQQQSILIKTKPSTTVPKPSINKVASRHEPQNKQRDQSIQDEDEIEEENVIARSSARDYLELAAAVEAEVEVVQASDISRQSCPLCERKFNPESIERHIAACEKAAAKKRTVFNMTAKRVKGTELEKFVKPPKTMTVDAAKALQQQKEAKQLQLQQEQEQQRQEELRQQSRQRKTNTSNYEDEEDDSAPTSSLPSGKSKPNASRVSIRGKPAQSAPNPNLTECPHCTRRFNQEAAIRHIPWCESQKAKEDLKSGQKNKGKKNAVENALEKRTKYQPPLPGAKKKDTSNDQEDTGEGTSEKQAQSSSGIKKSGAASGSNSKLAAAQNTLFCGGCGNRFPTTNAKFCFECGGRRG